MGACVRLHTSALAPSSACVVLRSSRSSAASACSRLCSSSSWRTMMACLRLTFSLSSLRSFCGGGKGRVGLCAGDFLLRQPQAREGAAREGKKGVCELVWTQGPPGLFSGERRAAAYKQPLQLDCSSACGCKCRDGCGCNSRSSTLERALPMTHRQLLNDMVALHHLRLRVLGSLLVPCMHPHSHGQLLLHRTGAHALPAGAGGQWLRMVAHGSW